MPDLTFKQQTFCQKFLECMGNASEAYRQAYNAENMSGAAINEEAYRLTQNPDVALRINELKAEWNERNKVSLDSLTQELEEARTLARQELQTATMVSASMGKAKLHGLVTDKQQIDGEMRITKIERHIVDPKQS